MIELAAKAGVTLQTVRDWEYDKSRPDEDILALLCEWLAIPTNAMAPPHISPVIAAAAPTSRTSDT